MKKWDSWFVVVFLVALLLLSTVGIAASADTTAVVSSNSMLKITKGMSPAVLLGHPDSEAVQLPSGRTIQLGKLRRLTALSQKLKMSKGNPQPTSLSFQPAATGIKINNANDLLDVLKRPDSETVELPSGKRLTVGLLRYLQPQVEQRLGRKLASTSPRATATGPVIKVEKSTDKEYWKNILQQPDATVLETPDGKRITIGDLKQSLGVPAASAVPQKR